MTRRPVPVGFAGIAPEWLQDLPTLQRQQRMRIAAVHDAAPLQALEGAARWEAIRIPSFFGLLESPLVDAIVIGNAGWLGWHAARFCVEQGIATLLVISRLNDQVFFDPQLPGRVQLELAMSFARGRAGLLMPGFPLRWQPVTVRARELTATSLGAVESLQVQAPGLPLKSRQLAELIDWCLYLVQSPPSQLILHAAPADGALSSLRIECRRPQKDGSPVSIQIDGIMAGLEHSGTAPQTSDLVPLFQARGRCRDGEFQLASPDRIRFAHGHGNVDEHLTSDRSAFDVMLDLFGRRLVGGLVPIPDLSDVLKARNLVLAAVQSAEQQVQLSLSEDGRVN